MKKTSGIVLLLVLAFSLVPVPAFAGKAELSLKYWHAGVSGADFRIGEVEEYKLDPLNGYESESVGTDTLMLQFGAGRSFILSGSYSLSPTVSLGVSYWGVNRASQASFALDNLGAEFVEEGSNEWGDYILSWSDRLYLITPPEALDWLICLDLVWDGAYESNYWQRWYGEDDYYGNNSEAFIALEGNLSMSALDVSGTMTLTGPGWEMGLSGGIRKAAFNQNRSKGFELLSEAWDRLINEEADYHYYDADKHVFSVDSTVNVSAIGPQVGIEGEYALADRLVLKAGAKAGLLFGTAERHAKLKYDYWEYYWNKDLEEPAEWVLDGDYSLEYLYPSTKDPVRLSTYDLSFGLAYQISEQWSIEAGYYASIWNGIPSPVLAVYDEPDNGNGIASILNGSPSIPIRWEEDGARTITVGGLTIGLNFKF